MLVSFCAALSAAIILLTISQTARSYPELPERVPLHIGPDGSADGFGPRPMIWTLVGMELVVAALFVFVGRDLAAQTPGTHGTVAGAAAGSVFILAILWRAQVLLISVAKSAQNRVPMRGFLAVFPRRDGRRDCLERVFVTRVPASSPAVFG